MSYKIKIVCRFINIFVSLLVQLISGKHDRIAGTRPVEILAESIDKYAESDLIEYHCMDTGHLAPFEKPLEWRDRVISFLNSTCS